MTTTEWGVVVGGLALIALINWYFFFSDASSADSGNGKPAVGVRTPDAAEKLS